METIIKSDDGLNDLMNKYGATIVADLESYGYWQVAILFPDGRFVVWHDYLEWNMSFDILVEGIIENGKIKLIRAFYKDKYMKDAIQINDWSVYAETVNNQIPLQFICSMSYDDPKEDERDASVHHLPFDKDYVSDKVWEDPKAITRWFVDTFIDDDNHVRKPHHKNVEYIDSEGYLITECANSDLKDERPEKKKRKNFL